MRRSAQASERCGEAFLHADGSGNVEEWGAVVNSSAVERHLVADKLQILLGSITVDILGCRGWRKASHVPFIIYGVQLFFPTAMAFLLG